MCVRKVVSVVRCVYVCKEGCICGCMYVNMCKEGCKCSCMCVNVSMCVRKVVLVVVCVFWCVREGCICVWLGCKCT